MTVDDESSVYVGGLPYDSTEDSLRKSFSRYGSVVAVKIINDRSTRGKCYGFVTFTNPRSAADAINDMDGRTIDGRLVRVNGVRTRGGRLPFARRHFPEYQTRDRDRERGYDDARERGYDDVRERGYDDARDGRGGDERSRERDESHEARHYYERDSLHEQDHRVLGSGDREVLMNGLMERDEAPYEDMEDNGGEPRDQDAHLEREMDSETARDRDDMKRKRKGSSLEENHGRGFLSDSEYGNYDEVKEQLEASIREHEELKEELSVIKQKFDEKGQLILDLQKKSKKLEDSLKLAKRQTSQRRLQLTKLHKCFLQVRDYTEKLKSSEQELQSLVDLACKEADSGDVIGPRHGLVNGKA